MLQNILHCHFMLLAFSLLKILSWIFLISLCMSHYSFFKVGYFFYTIDACDIII